MGGGGGQIIFDCLDAVWSSVGLLLVLLLFLFVFWCVFCLVLFWDSGVVGCFWGKFISTVL